MQNLGINTVTIKGRTYRYFRPTGQRLPDDEAEAISVARTLMAATDRPAGREHVSERRRQTIR